MTITSLTNYLKENREAQTTASTLARRVGPEFRLGGRFWILQTHAAARWMLQKQCRNSKNNALIPERSALGPVNFWYFGGPPTNVSQPPAEVCLTDLAWDYPGV